MELTNWKTIGAKLGLATLGRPALIGLAAIMVMVAAFAGRIIIDAATATEIPLEHEQVGSAEAENESMGSIVTSDVYVHVSGAVKEPGLVKLAEGSRVADAVDAAGGMTKKADEESINLARIVNDGEHIQVSEIGSTTTAETPAPSAQSELQNQTGLININNATEQELQNLPGIGPATASKIVEYRTSYGPFSQIEDITNVSGIGEKKFESIAGLICV